MCLLDTEPTHHGPEENQAGLEQALAEGLARAQHYVGAEDALVGVLEDGRFSKAEIVATGCLTPMAF